MAKRDIQENGQWPIAVTLLLCALFIAAIIIKAKSDIDHQKARIFDNSYSSARLISSDIDANLISLKSTMAAFASQSATEAAGRAAASDIVDVVATFGPNGEMISSTSIDTKSATALAAASQLANDIGWVGAVAREDGHFFPAISVRDVKNQTAVALIKIKPSPLLKSGQNMIVTDKDGAIVYSASVLKLQGFKNIRDALGFSSLPSENQNWGQFVKSNGGEQYLIGGSINKSGFIVFILEARANAEGAIYKTMLFYALLILGPILAFFGIWFVVKDQGQKSTYAELQMREAEKRLRIAIDGAKCGVWDWNITDDNVYLTTRLARSFGLKDAGRYRTEELLKCLSADDKLRLRSALRACVQIGAIDFHVEVHHPDNQKIKPVFLQFRGRSIGNKDDAHQVRIIGVSIDITEQMHTDMRANNAERRLKDAINSFAGPFALWGRGGTLIMWNDAFMKVFNIDVGLLKVGTKYDEIFASASQNIVSRRSDRSDPQAQEIQLQNGQWLRLIERQTSDGGMISLGLDISPQKQSEDNVNENNKRLSEVIEALRASEREAAELAKRYEVEKSRAEQASKSKDAFLANMSHELRTPLNAIIGFSDMMMREMYGPLGNPNYREYIRDINESGVHLLELINGVLDMAKIESGKFKIYPQNMSMEETIEQAIRIVRVKAEEKNIKIEQDIEGDDYIVADARAVRQILINLLSNAIKFTENGGRVLVRTRRDDLNITISVIDNGIGINGDDIPRLAKPFEQVENEHSRLNQGTGLGLALCNSFARMHGGSMSITSKVGVGTKVDVILPLVAIPHEEVAA